MIAIIGKAKQIARKLKDLILARAQYKDKHLMMSIMNLGLFDSKWYLEVNPDVKKNKIDPLSHYLKNGWHEGRTPFASYDETTYLQIAPDFDPDQTNPLLDIVNRLSIGTLKYGDILTLRKNKADIFLHSKLRLTGGITICGFLRSEIGLGQAARNIAYSANASGLNANFYNLAVPGRDNEKEFTRKCSSWINRGQALFVLPLNPNALDLLKKAPGRYLILYPYWELSRIPESCMESLCWCDEFWAPSSFIQEMLEPLGKTTTLIPQPVKIPLEYEINPQAKDSNLFTVLTYFDIDSHHTRKNPMASVKAFQSAFPKEGDVQLIVKLRGSNSKQEIRNKLRIAAQGDPRIVIIDKTISRKEIERLILSCNAFISLQRSEGFGFGPAEALASGKPVITTCYGGVTDFINTDTAYPVGFDLVSVKRGEYPDWENQVWADPIIADAIEALRLIKSNPNSAAAKGRAGRDWMLKHHSIEAVGNLIQEKLMA